jgi:APA family basic amino acid/polyamine antiporter
VGGTIGGGILRTPGLVAAELGSGSAVLLAWLLGGLYGLLGAICVAELGASLPRSGGWTVYARRAFGDGAGFVVGWTDWLGHCAGVAWVALTAGDYALALFPSLPIGSKAIALLVLALFTAIQLQGVRAGSGSQLLLSLAKTAAFLLLVAACFLLADPVAATALPALSATVATAGPPAWLALAAAWVLALQAIISTYDGWHSPIYFAEEFEQPERDLPRSLIGGVVAVIAIYVLVNLALLHVLPLDQLAASTLPVADAAERIFGTLGGQAITALALVSVLGLINASIMSAPRVLYGLARDGLLPAALTGINAGGTPVAALLLTSGAIGLLVLFGDFAILLAIASFLYVSLYSSAIVALLVLRRSEPELPRPFPAWGHPWSALVVLAGSLLFLVAAIGGDGLHCLEAALLVGLGAPIRWLAGGDASRASDAAPAAPTNHDPPTEIP